MFAILALGITAFLLCLCLTPILRDVFKRLDILDRPDGGRKSHAKAVPRMGGIPIVLSYAGALGLVYLFAPNGSRIYIQHGALLRSLLPAAGLVFLTGLIDDILCIKPWQKLAGQVVAAVLAVSLGARMSIGNAPVWVSVVLSIIWLIGCTNAVNLIDGMDGLATGVGLLATTTTLLVAIISRNMGLAMATMPLVGCLLAFLRYNFSPASVFLGDCGSLTIGFILGCFGLIWSRQSGTMLGMAAPLMALALPLIDVTLAIGRRFLRRVPIFKGDRSHIHHMLLGLGFTTRGAALLLYGVCGLFASFALFESFGGTGVGWPILFLFCLLVLIGVSRLNYIEFTAAWRTISHKMMLRAVQEEIYLRDLEKTLAGVETAEECWQVVRLIAQDFGFSWVILRLDGARFEEEFTISHQTPLCTIDLSLGDRGSLLLTRVSQTSRPSFTMSVLHRLQVSISEKQGLLEVSENSLTHAA